MLDAEVGAHTTSDPAALARVLGDAVSRAASLVGVWPSTLALRHPEFSEALVPELAQRGTKLLLAPHLQGLDQVARCLMESFVDGAPWPPSGHVERWADWGAMPSPT